MVDSELAQEDTLVLAARSVRGGPFGKPQALEAIEPLALRLIAEAEWHWTKGATDDARRCLQNAHTLAPDSPLVQAAQLNLEPDLGRRTQGLGELVDAHPRLQRPRLYLGLSMVTRGDATRGNGLLEVASTLQPSDPLPPLGMAAAASRLQDREGAVAQARLASDRAGSSTEVLAAAAIVQFNARAYAAAWRGAWQTARVGRRWDERLLPLTLPLVAESLLSWMVVIFLSVAAFGFAFSIRTTATEVVCGIVLVTAICASRLGETGARHMRAAWNPAGRLPYVGRRAPRRATAWALLLLFIALLVGIRLYSVPHNPSPTPSTPKRSVIGYTLAVTIRSPNCPASLLKQPVVIAAPGDRVLFRQPFRRSPSPPAPACVLSINDRLPVAKFFTLTIPGLGPIRYYGSSAPTISHLTVEGTTTDLRFEAIHASP